MVSEPKGANLRDWVASGLSDMVYRDRTGETYALRHNPAQRWYYFPNIAPSEAILIKSYESDPRAPRFSPHSAFDDPSSRPDAPAREHRDPIADHLPGLSGRPQVNPVSLVFNGPVLALAAPLQK